MTLGMKTNIFIIVLMWMLPDEAREAFEDANLEFWKEAIEQVPTSDEDPIEALVQKQLKSSSAPGPGIIDFMRRHGWKYGGMVDGRPVWTEEPYYRPVKLIVR